MNTLNDYLRKYGDISFSERPFNEVDGLVLSLMSYLDFRGLSTKKDLLKDLIWSFLKKIDYKEYLKHGLFQKDLYEFAKVLVEVKRYSNVEVTDYVYDVTDKLQFCALKMILPDNSVFISFEGTDETLIGWEENAILSYKYPTVTQSRAIKYINKAIDITDGDVYIGGHSKGGNLAVVAAMNVVFWYQKKIKKVYNFDGPGLLEREYKSNKYRNIKNKCLMIVPNYSLVGMIMNNDINMVIQSKVKGLWAHNAFNWYIDNNKFMITDLSELSSKFRNSLNEWLLLHTDDDKKKITEEMFNTFYHLGYNSIMELISIKSIFNIIGEMKNIDSYTMNLLKDLVSFNIKEMVGNGNE